MSKPSFLLTKKIPLKVYRMGKGEYVNGRYIKGSLESFEIEANIQPALFSEIKMFPESDHTKKWLNVFTTSRLRIKKEGRWGPDYFIFEDDWYEVRKEQTYTMGVLDHTHAMAARLELTPDGLPDPLTEVDTDE